MRNELNALKPSANFSGCQKSIQPVEDPPPESHGGWSQPGSKYSEARATVSETVSESTETVVQSCGELGRILLESPVKPAILLALNH